MKSKIIFIVSILGVVVALFSAWASSQRPPAQRAVFDPVANPYKDGLYTNGIIESLQSNGSNTNIYPEVSGPVTRITVAEGALVRAGDVLLTIDDSVQRAVTEQQQAQADAAKAVLDELKAQPRPENLEIALAQVINAQANFKNANDHYLKIKQAYESNVSVTKDDFDNAQNANAIAETNLRVVEKQYVLTKAGAWSFDIKNQELLYQSLVRSAAAAHALLEKYTIRAADDGVILSVGVGTGSYISSQGAYNTYTGAFGPAIVMGSRQDELAVRCYVDEILVPRLPAPQKMTAKLFVRGVDVSIPLVFERMQPYVSPKIELADQKQERVDVRVLPIVFKFQKPAGLSIFPGQLVDVYIGHR